MKHENLKVKVLDEKTKKRRNMSAVTNLIVRTNSKSEQKM